MEEQFDNWNNLKKRLHRGTTPIYANTREIWWCSFGFNVGTELFGKNELFERPVLVLKVYNKETIKVAPLTSKVNKGQYYASVTLETVTSCASLTQVKTISTKRLSRKVGRIDKVQFEEIITKYKSTF